MTINPEVATVREKKLGADPTPCFRADPPWMEATCPKKSITWSGMSQLRWANFGGPISVGLLTTENSTTPGRVMGFLGHAAFIQGGST